jgi:hypothetical protein
MTVSNVKSYSYDPVIAGKNFVINGGLDFWQRSTSPETPLYITSGNGYIADRWTTHQFQDGLHSRSTITPGSGPISQYALRVGSPSLTQNSGGSRMVAASMIESVNSIFLRNQTITFSFWIRFSSATFTSIANSTTSAYNEFNFAINYFTSLTDPPIGSTGSDSANNVSIANGSLPTVWTKYSITATVPSNTNNIMPRFGFGGLGSTTVNGTNWYEVADVQVEENTIPTQFSRAGGNYIEELRLCQRYYVRFVGDAANDILSDLGWAWNTSNAHILFKLPVQMRRSPTVIESSTIELTDLINEHSVGTITISGGSTAFSAQVNCATSGLTQFRPYVIRNDNNVNGFIAFGAEI